MEAYVVDWLNLLGLSALFSPHQASGELRIGPVHKENGGDSRRMTSCRLPQPEVPQRK